MLLVLAIIDSRIRLEKLEKKEVSQIELDSIMSSFSPANDIIQSTTSSYLLDTRIMTITDNLGNKLYYQYNKDGKLLYIKHDSDNIIKLLEK